MEVGKNLKEIDFDEVSVAHKIVEYNPTINNLLGSTYNFTDSYFTKDEVRKDTLASTDWDEGNDIRLVSKVFVPTGNEQSITASFSTFTQAKHLQEVRDIIEGIIWDPHYRNNLRYKTRQTLSELLGTARTEIGCPFTGCGFTILSTELYCSRAYTIIELEYDTPAEPQAEWYQDDGEWDIVTWTDPLLHIPLMIKAPTAYSKDATQISVSSVPGILPIIQEGKTRKESLVWGEGEIPLDWPYTNLPDDSYLFFENHYTRYTITACEYNEDTSKYDITFDPALKHDVKIDSDITISNHKVHQDIDKDTSTIIISASNSLLIELDEFLGKYGVASWENPVNYSEWKTRHKIDKYFSAGTLIKFQSHEKIYTIKSAEPNLVDENYQIELTENLERVLEADEAVFLCTPIRVEHWEEVRTALDNLDPLLKENDWGFLGRIFTKDWELGNKTIPPYKSWVSGGTSTVEGIKWSEPGSERYDWYEDPVLVCPDCGGPVLSFYSYWIYSTIGKISYYNLDTLKGIPQYVYESDGAGGYVWRQQMVDGEVTKYRGYAHPRVMKFDSIHECQSPSCEYQFSADTYYNVYTWGNMSHKQVTADGVKTGRELIDYSYGLRKNKWINDILGIDTTKIIFKNSILIYVDVSDSTKQTPAFAHGEYLTDWWSEGLLDGFRTQADWDDFEEG